MYLTSAPSSQSYWGQQSGKGSSVCPSSAGMATQPGLLARSTAGPQSITSSIRNSLPDSGKYGRNYVKLEKTSSLQVCHWYHEHLFLVPPVNRHLLYVNCLLYWGIVTLGLLRACWGNHPDLLLILSTPYNQSFFLLCHFYRWFINDTN